MKSNEELLQEKESLKLKHGKVITLEVPVDQDDLSKIATIFLKRPDRTTRSLISKLASNDGIKAIEAALKNLYIGGDDLNLVVNNDDAIVACEDAIIDILAVQKATLKKN
jgi:hypothetical protein